MIGRAAWIDQFVIAWLAARSSRNYPDNCVRGRFDHPGTIPIEDAFSEAETNWSAFAAERDRRELAEERERVRLAGRLAAPGLVPNILALGVPQGEGENPNNPFTGGENKPTHHEKSPGPLAAHYADYSWIKVRRHIDDPAATIEDRYIALNAHHVKETAFLIAEVRKLAARIDEIEGRDRGESEPSP